MLPTPPPSPTLLGSCCPDDRIGLLLDGWLELTSVLGVGAYGIVYTAVDIKTSIPYAVKALNKVGLDPRSRRFQQREIQLHHEASNHPNVVSLVRIMESAECTFVVLEFCPEGDLFTSITEGGLFLGNDAMAKRAFLQVLDAVAHCHSIGIYHRDLKPENILVSDSGLTVKLADFGLATKEYITDDFGCGSTFYMSPECQQSPQYSSCYASGPNDVWSLGIILVNLTCGRNPWKRACQEDSTYRAYSRNPHFLSTILPISAELESILNRIFEINPCERVGLLELRGLILSCPSFTNRPCSTGLPPLQPEKIFVPEVIYNTVPASPVSYPVSSNTSASSASSASSGSSGCALSDSASDRSSNSSWSSVSSHPSYDHVSKPQEAAYSTPPLYQPTLFQPVPQGGFFGSWSPYPCRPLVQPHTQSFLSQAPVVC